MLYATYDVDARRLVISNAGNPYPLVLRNRKIDTLQVAGVPLGLVSGSQYETVSLDVQPGDVVVFASDGVLESYNGEQRGLGVDGLATAIAAASPEASAQEISSFDSRYHGQIHRPRSCTTRRPYCSCPPRN
jgi:serine phosphatase RsbU (regulator of sigma subunit)